MYNTDYLLMSQKRFEKQRREFTMDGIQVFIKDKITNDINLKNVLDIINSYIPRTFLKEIDSIYVGMFDDFIKKDVNAAYKDGAIYISNEQQSEQDLIDDIVHEIAHSLEQPYGHIIYADARVEDEFLLKRKKLYDILKSEDLKPNLKLFLDLEYNKKMDDYLYKKVGYDRLNFIAASYDLFTSAYPATSLREYFASGFEYYFLEDPTYLMKISPQLYKKIEELHQDATE